MKVSVYSNPLHQSIMHFNLTASTCS